MDSKKIQDANIANPYTSSKMQIVPGQDVDLRLPRRASEEDDLLLENFFPERTDDTRNIFPRADRFYKWGYGGPQKYGLIING